MGKILHRFCIPLLMLLFWCAGSASAQEMTALIGGQLIDGLEDQPATRRAVLIEGELIVGVVDVEDIPDSATVLDLGKATILPGLIDSHAHPLMAGDDYQSDHLHNSSAYKALKGYRAMQRLLMAGWTSLRVAGDTDVFYGNQDIRRLIEEGVLEGPRLFGAAHYLSITGGGGDVNYFSPEQNPRADGLIVDSPDEARKAVRTEAKYGADWVKVLVTGAFMSVGDNPNAVQFSEQELRAIMEEANRQGMPVMAHAHASAGIKLAVRLGARSIEHGTYMDDEAIALMAEHGTYLVPTIYVGDYYSDPRNTLREQAAADDYSKNYRGIFLDLVGQAHRAGVPVVVGVDLGGYDYDPSVYVRELAVLMEAGMTAMEAIKAATSVPAAMLNKAGELGVIRAGALADIIAVAGDPLSDITTLERVGFVMRGGQVVQNRLSTAAGRNQK